MGVYDVHETASGVTIGFDDEKNDWVRVDKQAYEGSALGNIVRGAGRGVESIVQGINELSGEQPGIVRQRGEDLRRRQEAAQAVAPVAEGVGNVVPDIAAGVGLGLATGGLGLVPMLGAEAGLGAFLGGIRSGSAQERVQNAVLSSVLSIGGAVLGPAAIKGIGSALKMFDGLETKVLTNITKTVDNAGAELRQADEMGALNQAGSVGAAKTPMELVDEATGTENRLLETTDEVGADLMDLPRMQQMAERAAELDMPTPIGFGSRAMSPARLGQAANEFNPFGDLITKRTMNQQKAKMSQYLGEALGMKNAKHKDALFIDDLADAEAEISLKFESVRNQMPNIDGSAVARALESVGNSKAGVFGSFRSQKIIADAIENAKGRPILDGEEFMNSRSALSEEMADAYAKGKTASGDQLMAALNNMDDALQKALKKSGKDKVADLWQQARTQWRVLKMTQAPGAVNTGTGEVNPLSLLNRMMKPKSRGGWGRERPPAGTAARKLYDSLEIGTASQNQVAATGARAGIAGSLLRSNVGKSVAGGAAGSAAGLGIWDAMKN